MLYFKHIILAYVIMQINTVEPYKTEDHSAVEFTESDTSARTLTTPKIGEKEQSNEIEEANKNLKSKISAIRRVLSEATLSPRDKFALDYLQDKLNTELKSKDLSKKQRSLREYQDLIEVLGLQKFFESSVPLAIVEPQDSQDSSDEENEQSSEIKKTNKNLKSKISAIRRVSSEATLSPQDEYALDYLKDKLTKALKSKDLSKKQRTLREYQDLIEVLGLQKFLESSEEDDYYDFFDNIFDYFF